MSNATSSGGFSFRGHIRVLCSLHGIELFEQEGAAAVASMSTDGATLMSQHITVRPVNSLQNYFTALHEIGHRALRHRHTSSSARTILKEREAWDWAAKHAKVRPDIHVIQHINHCLGTYGDTKRWAPPAITPRVSRLP